MKNKNNETKIIKWIILLPIFGVILTSFILTNIFISSINEAHKLETLNIKEKHIDNLKNKIKERVESLSLLLENTYKIEILEAKKSMKDIVNIGYEKLKSTYKANKHLSKKEIFKIINEQLKDIKFFESNSHYFIYSIDENKISLASNFETKKETNFYKTIQESIKNKNETFITWQEKKQKNSIKLEKIAYIKLFKPLNIYIGTYIYLNDVKKYISKNAINFIENLDYENNGYIFILNSKKRILSHKNKGIVNIAFKKLDKKTQKNLNNHLLQAKTNKGTFIKYTQSEKIFKDFNDIKKISYIKRIAFLDWVIGTGLYTDKLDVQLLDKKKQLKLKLKKDIKTMIFVSSLVTLIIIIFLMLLSKRIKNIFHYYSKSLEYSNFKLKKLNEKLEQKVQLQVNSIREKDKLLNQQSKLVAMGELLSNIAHQWRQPLSAISTIASSIIIQKELGSFKEEDLKNDLKTIIKNTQNLSNTIEDFRSFTLENKFTSHFEIKNTIKKVLKLTFKNFQDEKIEIIQNIHDIKLFNYENELIQVILNILKNAKDAILESKEDKSYIFIDTKKTKDTLILEIYDNAGGIKEEIIDRIFEPYFTTKFKCQGKGIGLYMTKNILETTCEGKITVKNKSFIFNNQVYKGALFKIELPLNIKI